MEFKRNTEQSDSTLTRLRELRQYADEQFHKKSKIFNGEEAEGTESVEPYEVEDAHSVYMALNMLDAINFPPGKTYEDFLAEARQEREEFDKLMDDQL